MGNFCTLRKQKCKEILGNSWGESNQKDNNNNQKKKKRCRCGGKNGVLEMAVFSWKGTPQESKQKMLREQEVGKETAERKRSKEAELGEERTQTIVN